MDTIKRFVVFAALGGMSVSAGAINTGLSGDDGSAPQAAAQAPAVDVNEGKIVSITHGQGYSYLELEGPGGERFWVAGTKVEAKAGDRVRFDRNVVMRNFTSKFLNRTFDQLIFASSVTVLR